MTEQAVWIYGTIAEEGWGDVSAKDVRTALDKFDRNRPIVARINSPGGSVWEAVAIRTMLSQWPGGVNCQVDGLAASAASYLSTVGKTVAMARDGSWMAHDAWTVIAGNSDELQKASEHLDRVSDSMVSAYAAKSGKSRDEVRSLMRKETWYTSAGALDAGFVDVIIGEDGRPMEMNTAQASRNVRDLQAQLDALTARLAMSN